MCPGGSIAWYDCVHGEVMLLICCPRGELKSVHPHRGLTSGPQSSGPWVREANFYLTHPFRTWSLHGVPCYQIAHACEGGVKLLNPKVAGAFLLAAI